MKYESFITYYSKAMANVRVNVNKQMDRQMDKWMGQKLYAPDLLMRGHKNTH